MPGGLRLHRAFEEAGCLVINGGTGQSQLQVEVARAWGATVYAGTPSFLANLGDTAKSMGLDPRRDLHYRVGFSTAEALTPALRRELGDTFGIELFDHCGEAQIGPLAGECREHEGMHLHAQDLFCEFSIRRPASRSSPAAPARLSPHSWGRARCLWCATRPEMRSASCRTRVRVAIRRCVSYSSARSASFERSKAFLSTPRRCTRSPASFPSSAAFRSSSTIRRERLRPSGAAVATVQPVADPESLKQSLQQQLKATIIIQVDIELVTEADVPEAAGAPRFTETMIDLRKK
jgi:hypothetical protein